MGRVGLSSHEQASAQVKSWAQGLLEMPGANPCESGSVCYIGGREPKWRNGRRDGFKIHWASQPVWVRVPPSVLAHLLESPGNRSFCVRGDDLGCRIA